MERVVIIGAGARGREVAESLRQQARKPGNTQVIGWLQRNSRCQHWAWTTIGAGAVAVSDLPANVTAVDVAARVIAMKKKGWHEEATSAAGT
jgi:hypothetical protein